MTSASIASPAQRHAPPPSRSPAAWRRRLLLPVIFSATFMTSFDYMVVNVAAPSLARDLHPGPAALELSIAGYAFTYASGLVTGGRLGDLFGHRRLFIVGLVAFTIASLLCGLARSPAELVAARLLQGLAAAAVAPQVLALITAIFPVSTRPRALSRFGVILGLGGISGASVTERADDDPAFTPAMVRTLGVTYLSGTDPRVPLASPLFASLTGLPPLLIQAGTAELLLSDSERLAKVAADAGVDVTLQIGEGLPHFYQALLGTPEVAEATRQIGAFVRARVR